MTEDPELETVLADLRSTHDVLPFLERMIPAAEAVFRRVPDDMVDLLAASADFMPPSRPGVPVWLQIAGEGGGTAEMIITRSPTDGELWVIAPVDETD